MSNPFPESTCLILPGDPEFEETLGTALPLNWVEQAYRAYGEFTFVADCETGLLRVANHDETDDYLMGGEYDTRLSTLDDESLTEVEFVYHC